eukprot:5300334-Amphidinium_carterae.1
MDLSCLLPCTAPDDMPHTNNSTTESCHKLTLHRAFEIVSKLGKTIALSHQLLTLLMHPSIAVLPLAKALFWVNCVQRGRICQVGIVLPHLTIVRCQQGLYYTHRKYGLPIA